jgi:hypothetical protein
VKRGLYAVNFGGGQVDITSGKFVFSATEAYLIEDGRITAPVKGATLIGNGPEAMNRVSMVGTDLRLDEGVGICGKDGQSVPVGRGPAHAEDRADDGGRDARVRRGYRRLSKSSPPWISPSWKSRSSNPRRAGRPLQRLLVGFEVGLLAAHQGLEFAEQLAVRVQRLVVQAFLARIARKLAQVLAIGVRMGFHQFRQRRVAAFDQALAHRLEAMQCGGFAARVGAVVLQRAPDRVQRVVVLAAHVLGQELQLALARAGRGDAARFAHHVAQRLGHRHPGQLRVGQGHQLLAEVEHGQGLAPLLAAARAEEITGFFVASAHR